MMLVRQQQPQTSLGLLPGAKRLVLPGGIASTAGPSIIATAAVVGLGLDDWQQDIGRVTFAKLATGEWASDTVAMSIPRQAGKTYVVAAMVFAYCLIHKGVTVAWTAHHNKVMLETFASLKAVAVKDKVRKHVKRTPSSAEYRAIEFVNGSRIVMAARESGALRGVAKVAVLVLDEAQILTDNALSDVLPTQNAAAHPLTIMLGTPPRPKDPGEAFTQQRNEALAAERSGRPLELATWIEFGADDDADTDDNAQLRQANPSYRTKRTPLRALRKLRRSLTEDHYRREVLGIWDDKSTPSVIAPSVWEKLLDEASEADTKLVMAMDVTPDRKMSAVAFAGVRFDGRIHMELDEVREGVGWLIDHVVGRCSKNPIAAVVIDEKSPAAVFIPKLRRALAKEGLRVRVVVTTANEMTDACSQFFDAAHAEELAHIGQVQLTESLYSARKRSIGDRWAWNRKSPESNIAPIVAVTLAVWGVLSPKIRSKRTGGGSGKVIVL